MKSWWGSHSGPVCGHGQTPVAGNEGCQGCDQLIMCRVSLTSRHGAASVIREMTTEISSRHSTQIPDQSNVLIWWARLWWCSFKMLLPCSQIIKGGAGQFVLHSCPCNGHVGVPNFTPRCPFIHITPLVLQSSDTSWKDSGAQAAGDNGAENSPGVIWYCLVQAGGKYT